MNESSANPLVSCLLLTADRRRFVPDAIRHFLKQDYPARELLVIDDGPVPVEDLVPVDPRIRLIRVPGRNTIGAKRNIGCNVAAGQLIAHWDDDDWMATWRLSYQVSELLKYDADICGLRQLYFWGPQPDQAWEYVYESESQPWVAGGTMLYKRSLWERNNFSELNVGEDNDFVWSQAGKTVLPLVDRRFYVATIHSANTSPKLISPERWRPVPLHEIQQVIGPDWNDYAQLVFPGEAPSLQDQAIPSDEPVPPFTAALRNHLLHREFVAFNAGRSVPLTRRWELPFAIFQAQLADAMAVLDCSINPAGLGEQINELYPLVLYRHWNPIPDGRTIMPPMAPDACFDRVFCLNTIEHLLEPQRDDLISSMAAKLKPGGLLIVTFDSYFDSSWSRPEWLATGLLRIDRREVVNGFNKITNAGLAALCSRHGLQALLPPPPDPSEGDPTLYLNQPPLEHPVVGAVFTKGAFHETAHPSIVFSLLTWNTRVASLDSLEAHVQEARMLRRLGHDARICVVDNGSIDGTAEQLRSLEGPLDVPHRFIFNPSNFGNSRARNQIIDYALECGSQYLLFVDGDIEIVPFSSFVMLRHMQECGSRLACFGPHSLSCTPERERTSPAMWSLAGCQIQTSDTLAWTQYGIFRMQAFRDGVRFEESGPFGDPGHGLEDIDLAFQISQLGYVNQHFTGITYLHRNLSSSVGILSEQGMEPTEHYYRRKEFLVRKWENVPAIAEGPLRWVRNARAPWFETRKGRRGLVRFTPSAPVIGVPGEVIEWVDRSVSDMMDRTELIALAATLASFDWSRSDLIVEIGAYIGTTTVFMARVLESIGRHAKILSIDPFERCQPDDLNPQGNYNTYIENIRANGMEDRCLALVAFSADAATVVPDRIGVLLIDGSHYYDAARADLDLYVPKVAPGGYIFIDDYGPAYPDVMRAIDEYLAEHPALEVIVKSYYVILRRPLL